MMRSNIFPSGGKYVLIAILALGAALRFYGITSKGLFFWDEGIQMQEAQCLYSITAGLKEYVGADAVALKIKEKITGKDLSHIEDKLISIRRNIIGRYPETAKPTHIALIAASMALFGDHDYCGNVMSALCGTLTIVFIFYLGKRIGGSAVGLASAFLLAISPLHLIYSRETLAESDSILFFYCAFLLWLRSKDNASRKTLCLFLAGICAGISLTCNDRWIIIPFIFLFFEIAERRLDTRKSTRNIFVNYGLWVIGFCAPIVAWEVIYYFLKNSLSLIPLDYFDQMKARAIFHIGFNLGYGGVVTFLRTIASFEGMAAAILLAIGAVFLCVRRKGADAQLLIILLFTFALYTFRPHHFLRIISLAIPCFYLIIGNVLCAAGHAAAERRSLAAMVMGICALIVTFLIVAPDVSRDVRIIRWRSRYKNAIGYLLTQSTPRHYSTNQKLSGYYLGDASAKRPPREFDTRGEMPAVTEYPYLLTDMQRYFQTTFGPSTSEWVSHVERDCKPVFEVQEDFDALFFEHFAFEHSVDYHTTSTFLKNLDISRAAMVRIYRLADCLQEQ